MYLFHGTSEENALQIIKYGFKKYPNLKGSTKCLNEYGKIKIGFEWGYFLGPAIFFCTQPSRVGITWDERHGSDPIYFARWNKNDFFSYSKKCGSLIVLKVPKDRYSDSIMAIYRPSDVEQYYPIDSCSRKLLFILKQKYRKYLKEGLLDNKIKEIFKGNEISLDDDANLSKADEILHNAEYPSWIIDTKYLITDYGKSIYVYAEREYNSTENFNELNKRKLNSPSEDCQVLIKNEVVNDFILFGFRVWTGEKIVNRFNPKYMTKEKHKKKNITSLIWHEVLQLAKLSQKKPFYRKYK